MVTLEAWHSEQSGVLRIANGGPAITGCGFTGEYEGTSIAAQAKRLIFS